MVRERSVCADCASMARGMSAPSGPRPYLALILACSQRARHRKGYDTHTQVVQKVIHNLFTLHAMHFSTF